MTAGRGHRLAKAAGDLLAEVGVVLHGRLGDQAVGVRRGVQQQVTAVAHRAIVHVHELSERLDLHVLVGVPDPVVTRHGHVALAGKPQFAVRIAGAGGVARPSRCASTDTAPRRPRCQSSGPWRRPLEDVRLGLMLRQERQHVGPALFGRQRAAVEPDVEQLAVAAPQFGRASARTRGHTRPAFSVAALAPIDQAGIVDFPVSVGGHAGVEARLDAVLWQESMKSRTTSPLPPRQAHCLRP